MQILETLNRLLCGEQGATSVEYALMLVGIFLAIFLTVGALGLRLSDIFATPALLDALLP